MSFWRRIKRWFVVDPVGDLTPWAERTTRSAFFPRVSQGEGAARGSRFNGRPFVPDGEAWPACSSCAKPMALLLQLDLDTLPEPYAGRFGTGLLQQFYCLDEGDHEDIDGWETFNDSAKLTRIIPPNAAGAVADGDAAPAMEIVGWEERKDLCHPEEAVEHGMTRQVERMPAGIYRSRFICEALNIDTGWLTENAVINRVHDKVFNPAGGDKLGGWPAWIQGVEYPNCPRCTTRMQYVFQIDSNDHVPYMFGDVGCGHITQCPTHKDVVTFGWACS